MPKGRYLLDDEVKRIEEMSKAKLEQKVIAEELGISVATVRRYQQKLGIPASNRYNGGFVSSSILSSPIGKETNEIRKEEEPQNCFGVMVAEKVITLVGANTTFLYTIGTKMNSVKITTNNAVDIEIDLKDLVAFGNEILDVADKITEMKSNVWSV